MAWLDFASNHDGQAPAASPTPHRLLCPKDYPCKHDNLINLVITANQSKDWDAKYLPVASGYGTGATGETV